MFQMKKGSEDVKSLEIWMNEWTNERTNERTNEWIKCTRGDNNYNNNFIDFIFDMKISVLKQSIQWQMKQESKIKVK